MAQTKPTWVTPTEVEKSDLTPREKWSRDGNRRLEAVIAALRMLGKTNTATYERRPEDIDAIEALLDREVGDCLRELRRGLERKPEFQKLF